MPVFMAFLRTSSLNMPPSGAGWPKKNAVHAELIKKLYLAEKKGQVIFIEGKIKTHSLNAYIAYLETLIKRAGNDEFDLKSAAGQALDLETGLSGKKFLSRFQIVDPKHQGLMARLEDETKNHIEKIRNLIAALN